MQRWARTIASARELPLADVLAWDEHVLLEEAARHYLAWATREAARLLTDGTPPGPDPSLRYVRAMYVQLEAADRERKARENDAAFAELIEQGAFGG